MGIGNRLRILMSQNGRMESDDDDDILAEWTLSQQDWYWGASTRRDAETALADQPYGTFLVRKGARQHRRPYYVVSWRDDGRTRHLCLKSDLRDGRRRFFVDGLETDDVDGGGSFFSVVGLVEFIVAGGRMGRTVVGRHGLGRTRSERRIRLWRPAMLCRFNPSSDIVDQEDVVESASSRTDTPSLSDSATTEPEVVGHQPAEEDSPPSADDQLVVCNDIDDEGVFDPLPPWSLEVELQQLAECGWYWGPMSRDEATAKLAGRATGSFLVRNCSHGDHLFCVSLHQDDATYHMLIKSRVVDVDGSRWFYISPVGQQARSVVHLIDWYVTASRTGAEERSVTTSGRQILVSLQYPVSRFREVATLQQLCRFVVCQNIRVDILPPPPPLSNATSGSMPGCAAAATPEAVDRPLTGNSPSVADDNDDDASAFADALPRWSLKEELDRLDRHGWYWGPMKRRDAEDRLADRPDGSFLVRDCSKAEDFFCVSLRANGVVTHHIVDFEFRNGRRFYYVIKSSTSSWSLTALIEYYRKMTEAGMTPAGGFVTSNGRWQPMELRYPVSRFEEVPTLQQLCRFVVRKNIRIDLIGELPLPTTVKDWVGKYYY